MKRWIIAGIGVALFGAGWCLSAGERPYEMVWANRTEDDHPPLVALTDPSGWQVEVKNAVASFTRSDDLLLFGDGVCKLVYRGTGSDPVITLRPPQPVAITQAFDAVTCWIYGNNHHYAPNSSTPPVTVYTDFTDAKGHPFSVHLAHVHFKEWMLCHRRLSDHQIATALPGSTFRGFTIRGGTNPEDRVLYFNSLAVFTESFPPLTFKPRAKRGVQLFPELPQGLNTGDGTLPFPNTPLTVIPPPSSHATNRVFQTEQISYIFERRGPDGVLEIELGGLGKWDEMRFRWNGSEWHPFALGGGIYFAPDANHPSPFRAEKEEFSSKAEGDRVIVEGDLSSNGKRLAHAAITFHLEDMALAVDLQADGDQVAEIRFGNIDARLEAEPIPFPYYTYGYGDRYERPCVLALRIGGKPFFHSAIIDLTQSNASRPFCGSMTLDGAIASNGGTRYLPKTDGKRNSCFERFVYAFAPTAERVFPNIPNPVSPWKAVTGTHLWRAHGAGNRERDIAYWRNVRRRGMKWIAITDHESGWRDGNESFTFRTAPAPKKGGDAGQYRYARILQDELGFVYGPYNNFTDFATVNGFWHIDRVTRDRENQLQHAWERCYAPKPSRAVEFCEALTPIIESKFHFSTAYCDVHTAVTPWDRTDFDARVPGAGTFAATFYAFGEIMLLQKAAWDGPVYSEGNNHFPYCGLTDGNYAQDQPYRPAENPWLVDFDLRRMHPLCCNFGMGNLDMFYPGKSQPADRQLAVDRFLAATLAFGHPCFFLNVTDHEFQSYFMVQAIAARYTQAEADTIRYADETGKLWPTSEALLNRCFERSQPVTRYTDGTVVMVNGSPELPFFPEWEGIRLALPPNGFAAVSGDGKVYLLSALTDGHRADLSVSPEAVYINGRGKPVRFSVGGADGMLLRLLEDPLHEEIFLAHTTEAALPYPVESITALNEARQPLGEVPSRFEGGATLFKPFPNAFSYAVVKRAGSEANAPDRKADFARFAAAPEALATVRAPAPAAFKLPARRALGMAFRGKPEENYRPETGASIHSGTLGCGGVMKPGYFIHPPYRGGVGYAFVRFILTLPETPLCLTCFVGKQDGGDTGDGILHQIRVRTADGQETLLAQQLTKERVWVPLSADLSPWAGKRITLDLISDVGPNDDSTTDWGVWGDIKLVPKAP
ncbi:MAG: hypothetical protein J6334_03220 [Kiritimatiellae bacterium]|nr:hypothetical protein [Kiritimatiellia bacterium]